MSRLFTHGKLIRKTAFELESYDFIAFSKVNLRAAVFLQMTTSGYLDLSSELQSRASRFVGSSGNDTLVMGAGNDTIYGGSGDDQIWATRGNDLMYGGSGDDTFVFGSASVGNLRIFGGADTDRAYLETNARFSRIALGVTASVEVFQLSGDLFGTSGADIFDLSGILAFSRFLTSDDILMGGGNDRYVGMQVADDVYGEAGNDTIYGGIGDDLINGGSGNDELFGGDGNDIFVVDTSSPGLDRLYGGDGTDTLSISSGNIAGGINSLNIVESSSVEVLELDSDLFGTSGADIFDLSGILAFSRFLRSIDILMGGGNDRYVGMQAADDVYGEAGNDTIYGGIGDDLINGGSGNDELFGGDGNDIFVVDTSSPGLDRLYGSDGTDTLSISSGNIVGGINSLNIVESSSVEVLELDSDLFGTSGADIFDLSGILAFSRFLTSIDILMGGGNDRYVGMQAADDVYGEAGNDTIYGGLGIDSLYGGEGNDVFVFDQAISSGNIDLIYDFSATDDVLFLKFTDGGPFATLTVGSLASVAFKIIGAGGSAIDSSDRILYDRAQGQLFYDPDGNGTSSAVQFAAVVANTYIDQFDFAIV